MFSKSKNEWRQHNETFDGNIKSRSETEKLFVPYIMAGAQGLDKLEEEIAMLVDQGAAAIELGVPFSDPVADGPTIQAAGLRALHNR